MKALINGRKVFTHMKRYLLVQDDLKEMRGEDGWSAMMPAMA